jgi:transcriptional regulator with XRE-family HTH domain
MNDNILSRNLKTVRSVMGLNQFEFAELMGVPRTTYAHHEQGNSEPSLSFMERLMKITGKPLESFIGGDLSQIPVDELRKDIMAASARFAAKANIS